jgi:hypothetical protein
MKPPSNTHLSKPKQRAQLWTKDDLAYAFECAAEFLEAEEWPSGSGAWLIASISALTGSAHIEAMAAPSPLSKQTRTTQMSKGRLA